MNSVPQLLAATALLLVLPACNLTPAQKREPTKVANNVATKILPAMRSGNDSTVFPKRANFPSQAPLPSSVIQGLAQRVRSLPQTAGPMTVADVVSVLGLSPYRDHVSRNVWLNTYFVYLDSSHILNLICDPVSLRAPFPAPNGIVATHWDTVVTEVQLRQDPDRTLATRQLPAP